MQKEKFYEEIMPDIPEEDQVIGKERYCLTELVEGLEEEVATLKGKIEAMAETHQSTLETLAAVENYMEEMTKESRR